MSEVHLYGVDSEFDRLLEQTAQSIDIDVTILRNKLRDAWYSDSNRFDEATLNVLWEIERTGGYSITQTELIADAIRVTAESRLSSEATAKHVLYLISVGESFDLIIKWLLLDIENT